jgi:hypothetical protein
VIYIPRLGLELGTFGISCGSVNTRLLTVTGSTVRGGLKKGGIELVFGHVDFNTSCWCIPPGTCFRSLISTLFSAGQTVFGPIRLHGQSQNMF